MNGNYEKNEIDANAPLLTNMTSCLPLEGVLYVPNMKRYERIWQRDILFVKGEKSHVKVQLVGGRKMSFPTHLGHFYTYLDPTWFVRTARSYIVNIQHIEAITSRIVVVEKHEISLTEGYRQSLLQRLPLVHMRPD